MSKSPSGKALLILAMTGSLGVAALAFYVKVEPGAQKVPPSLMRQDAPTILRNHSTVQSDARDQDDQEPTEKVDARVYTPQIDGPDANLTRSSTSVPKGQDPLAFVAASCLKEANVEDARVLNVDVRHGIAVVNFSRGIDSGMGSEQEGAFLKALQIAYGQFSTIKQIEIDREGVPVTSLGSVDISGPLDVIRPGASSDSESKPTVP
jgi:hypothetical protein